MKILTPDELSIIPLPCSQDETSRCEIVQNGQRTGRVVEGAVLEAAVEWRGHTVVMLTEGVPYEDALRVCLFSPEMNLLDRGFLGGIYSTGRLSKLRLAEPNKIHFCFIGGVE